MDPIKIIFFDIDGTLVDMDKKRISSKMLDTLTRLKERGVLLCLATGRGPLTLPHFDGVAFDAYLTFNGSYCFNKKETIFSHPLFREDVAAILRNAAAISRPVSVATKDRLASNGSDDDLITYYALAQRELEITKDFDTVATQEVYQIMLGCRKDERHIILRDTRNAKVAAWLDWAVDIIPADGGKGTAIGEILNYYHLDRSDALAFGDGNNDIEMLQSVGMGVAMENASTELKAIAKDICGHVQDDGIYHYCMEHGLI